MTLQSERSRLKTKFNIVRQVAPVQARPVFCYCFQGLTAAKGGLFLSEFALSRFFEAFDILNRNADSFPIFGRADYVGAKTAIAESPHDRRPTAVFSITVSYCLAVIIVHF